MRGFKTMNSYANEISEEVYRKTPKAVWAAIAISALTSGGDYLELAEDSILKEWEHLYNSGVIPQRPPTK